MIGTPILYQVQWQYAATGLAVLARQTWLTGLVSVQADFGSIAYKAKERISGTVTDSGSLTIASVIFNTLQTGDPRWTADDDGFNFVHIVPAAAFPDPNKEYRVSYKFTPTGSVGGGQPVGFGVNVPTKPLETWSP